jgi:hypothetical protein
MVMIANASPRNLSAKFGVCCFPSTPPAIEVQCQSSDKLRWPRFISESNSIAIYYSATPNNPDHAHDEK